MYNLKFGCQSYPWKMGKHFGQLPRMLKVAAEAGFQSIECEIDMLGTWFHDRNRMLFPSEQCKEFVVSYRRRL